jgi:nucleotide-binding universal stress UspA family protein
MLPIQHLLFPIDFSARCLGAAPFVAAVAKRYGARLTLLSAVEPLAYPGITDPGAPIYVEPETLRTAVQSRLDAAAFPELAGIPAERVAVLGNAAAEITGYAHQHAVDLIMMPTHGYGPFRRLLLGSVTAKVLHDARCPVWTGAHMEGAPIHDHVAWRTLLCAVDRSEAAVALMRWAAELARDAGASLRLIHAIPGVEAWPERQFDREFEETVRADAQKYIGELQTHAGVAGPLCVATGDVASGVRDEALRHNADLVVIGRGAIQEGLGRLRAHAHSIIRHAPCPVISV